MENEKKKEIRAALYLRVSTDEQAKEGHYGLDIQEKGGKSLCDSLKSEGYVLNESHIYRDEGASGGLPAEKRPALKQLFEDAKEKQFDIVIVYKIDRMARDLRILLNMLKELKDIGIGFRSITEPFDTSSLYGNSMLQTMGMFAELERGMIRERTSSGRESAARKNKWVMGLTPFGFKRDEKTGGLEVIPVEARAVQQFFRWVADEKMSLHEVQRRANNSIPKLPAPKYRIYKKSTLNYWHKRTINRILVNEVYTGTTYFRKYKRPFRYIQSLTDTELQRPKGDWIQITGPQVITPELFLRTQKQLLRNRELARRNQQRDYLFSKLIYCGECGFKMFGGYQPPRKDGNNGTKYYHGVYRKVGELGETKRCPRCKQYAEVRLEPIWDTLQEILKHPKIIFNPLQENLAKRVDKTEVAEQIQRVEQELKSLQEKNTHLDELYLDCRMAPDKYNQYRKEYQTEAENLKNERLKLDQFLLTKKEQKEREQSIKKMYNAIRKQLDKTTYKEKAEIIRLFISKIKVFAKENIAEVIFQFSNERLIPVLNSDTSNLQDNRPGRVSGI
ncbi:MAG: recombinase family protein [Candidatus Firestonebacteria bacterium]